jgi:hypothetical protein
LSGRDGVGTLFGDFFKVFLTEKKCTGRWPRGHLRVQSVQVEVHVKELSERTLAREHLCYHISVTGLWLNTIQRPVTLMW